jgi:hypothetical protein
MIPPDALSMKRLVHNFPIADEGALYRRRGTKKNSAKVGFYRYLYTTREVLLIDLQQELMV